MQNSAGRMTKQAGKQKQHGRKPGRVDQEAEQQEAGGRETNRLKTPDGEALAR